MTETTIERLIQHSLDGHLLGQAPEWVDGRLDDAQVREATGQIQARPDATSFHLLMTLRRAAPVAYAALPAPTRAAVLVDTLRSATYLNDFGHLGPGGGADGPAGEALIDTGASAREPLIALLEDQNPAPLRGSEAASMSSRYGYRRSDFAYRFLRRLDGENPDLAEDPAERDRLQDQLRVMSAARSETPTSPPHS